MNQPQRLYVDPSVGRFDQSWRFSTALMSPCICAGPQGLPQSRTLTWAEASRFTHLLSERRKWSDWCCQTGKMLSLHVCEWFWINDQQLLICSSEFAQIKQVILFGVSFSGLFQWPGDSFLLKTSRPSPRVSPPSAGSAPTKVTTPAPEGPDDDLTLQNPYLLGPCSQYHVHM